MGVGALPRQENPRTATGSWGLGVGRGAREPTYLPMEIAMAARGMGRAICILQYSPPPTRGIFILDQPRQKPVLY